MNDQPAVSIEQLKEDEEIIELCCQTAMMGALAGMENEVVTLVDFLTFVMPESLKVKLTETYTEMLFGRSQTAVAELKTFIAGEHSDSQFAKAFLNFAEILAGDTKDAADLERVAKLEKSAEQLFADQALDVLRRTKKIV
jgi:hypothetical protein